MRVRGRTRRGVRAREAIELLRRRRHHLRGRWRKVGIGVGVGAGVKIGIGVKCVVNRVRVLLLRRVGVRVREEAGVRAGLDVARDSRGHRGRFDRETLVVFALFPSPLAGRRGGRSTRPNGDVHAIVPGPGAVVVVVVVVHRARARAATLSA